MVLYCGPFLLLGMIPAVFYTWGGWAPLATVACLLVVLIGAEWLSPRGPVPESRTLPERFRLLPMIYIPCQLAVIGWAALAVRDPHLPAAATVALIVSVGVTTGVFGMLSAHELAHSQRRAHNLFAAALLTGMSYRQFRIAHIYGHHRWAGTERDAATARLGEGFYAFLLRTIPGQFREAWQFEERRRANKGSWRLANRALQDLLATAILFLAAFSVLGWRSGVFLFGESAVAIVVLELFNYIAHYGLLRAPAGNGRRQALCEMHSWNSSNIAANMLIFNMGRHSDHHRMPFAAYQTLSWRSSAPELPFGYAGSILLALVPPLWRRAMDPEVARLRAKDTGRPRLAA